MIDLEPPQLIEVIFEGQPYQLKAWRYEDEPHFLRALHQAGIRAGADEKLSYYVDTKLDPAAEIYLLNKSINTLTIVATLSAFHICHLAGANDDTQDWEAKIAGLAGKITSELYSQQKYF